jgi:hypothetical protein
MKKSGVTRAAMLLAATCAPLAACDTFQELPQNDIEAADLETASNLLFTEVVLATDVAGPLANRPVNVEFAQLSPPVVVGGTTLDEALDAVLGAAIAKYGPLLNASSVNVQEIREKAVEAVRAKVEIGLGQALTEGFGLLGVAGSREIEYTGCNVWVDYDIRLTRLADISAHVEDVTFDIDPAFGGVRAHLRLGGVSFAPTLHFNVDAKYCEYGVWIDDVVDEDGVAQVFADSLDVDVDIRFPVEASCAPTKTGGTCCEPVVRSELSVHGFSLGGLTKEIETLTLTVLGLDFDFDPDDYFGNDDLAAALNGALSSQGFDADALLDLGAVRYTDADVQDSNVAFVVEHDDDGDGLFDACDVCPETASNFDPDRDGRCTDNCAWRANPDQLDTDGDGLGNACDSCPKANIGDKEQNCFEFQGAQVCYTIGDGVDDACDNCAGVLNPDQRNTDGDALGDACDADDDNDGTPDAQDNCPTKASAGQADQDGDGVGDVCDNCVAVANASQANYDGDALGNACDPDIDGDGVANAADNCPDVGNALQQDLDGDTYGDACDADPDCNPGLVASVMSGQCEDVPLLEELYPFNYPILRGCIGTGCVELLDVQVERLLRVLWDPRVLELTRIRAAAVLGALRGGDARVVAELERAVRSAPSRAFRDGVVAALGWNDLGTLRALHSRSWRESVLRQRAALSRVSLPDDPR